MHVSEHDGAQSFQQLIADSTGPFLQDTSEVKVSSD